MPQGSDNLSFFIAEGYSGFPVEIAPQVGLKPGSTEWILDAVKRHAMAEEDSLSQYRYIATASGDPIVALVMELILQDEERHHTLLQRIEASLRDALNWTHSPHSLPLPEIPGQAPGKDLFEATGALIQEEHTGARYLRELAHDEKKIGAGLHSVLLEMMAMDSEKHARLLQFVRDRLAPGAARRMAQL